jgi:hypothetical protein
MGTDDPKHIVLQTALNMASKPHKSIQYNSIQYSTVFNTKVFNIIA